MLLVSHRNLTRVFYCTQLQDPQAEPAKSQRLMSQSQRLMSDSCSRFCVSTPVHFLVLLRKGVATVKVHRLSLCTCDCDLKENWFLRETLIGGAAGRSGGGQGDARGRGGRLRGR